MPEKSPGSSPFWAPHAHADRRPILLTRARIVAALRAWFADQRLCRGRDRGAANLARQRDASACFRDRARGAGRHGVAALSAHLAGIRLQEVTGRGRAAHRRIRQSVSQSRARRAAPSRIHDDRMVSRARAVFGLDGGLRRAGAEGGRDRGRTAIQFSRPRRRSVCRAGADDALRKRSRALPASISWRRCRTGKPDRDGSARAAQAAGIRVAEDDHWGDIFSKVLVERIEGKLGIGRATILDEYPAVLSALARPAQRSARRRAFRALCLRRRARQRFRRAHRSRRAAASGSNTRWRRRRRIYGERYPIDEDFIAALRICRRQAASRSGSTGW